MGKYKIVILGLIVISVGFYFRNNISNIYNNAPKNLQNLQKTDLVNIVNKVENMQKRIFNPAPLNIGGKENQVVLTKAKIIAQTNIQRYNNGLLPPLIENLKLNDAAKAKVEDMFAKGYFEHISPSGVGPGDLAKIYGYDYIVSGENLILGNFKSEQEVVQLWMDSPGHRANILNNRYTEIGVAIIKGKYKGDTVWIGVQEFGLPLSACSQADTNLKNQIDFNENRLDQLSVQMDAKKEEINNTDKRSSEYNILVDEYNQLVNEYNLLNQETKNIIVQYNNQINIFNQCVVGK